MPGTVRARLTLTAQPPIPFAQALKDLLRERMPAGPITREEFEEKWSAYQARLQDSYDSLCASLRACASPTAARSSSQPNP